MPSVVQIANLALAEIGETAISAMTEANPRARNCNQFYEMARDTVIRELKPASCTARTVLAPTATAPDFGYAYEFQIPSDCKFLIEVQPKDQPWKLEGRSILSDETELDIIYCLMETDPAQFDDGTVQAIAMRLAWHISKPLTASVTQHDEAWKAYKRALASARADSQAESGSESTDGDFSWLSARTR